MTPYEELQESVISGEIAKVKDFVRTFLERGNSPEDIMFEGLIPSMSVIGQRFKAGEIYIPELIASAEAMKEGLELLRPLIAWEKASTVYIGKVVIGTVHGDIHNIGKNIVSMMLQSAGFAVVDLGVDIPTNRFLEAVKQEQPNILALSALLTTTMPAMGDVIEALRRNDLRDKVKVLVGGAPVTQEFADSIGADGYALDAVSGVEKARQVLGKG